MAALSLRVTAKDFRGPHRVVTPLREELAGKTQTSLIVLLGASAALLLIACVNLANLLLSRGAARRREVAVRAALGAGRGRLIAQFSPRAWCSRDSAPSPDSRSPLPAMRFLETLVPETMAADAADARLARAGVFRRRRHRRRIDLRTCARAGRVAARPARRTARRRARHSGARSHWFQHSLIIIETALAVMLLTSGGLLLQTFQHLRNIDLGMRSDKLLTFVTPLFRYKDFDQRVAFVNAELEEVRAIPGVISAGAIDVIPFT